MRRMQLLNCQLQTMFVGDKTDKTQNNYRSFTIEADTVYRVNLQTDVLDTEQTKIIAID